MLAKKLNGVKKCTLTYKYYDTLAAIDLNKIENWKEVKVKSIWTNTQFKSHKEINNNIHFCFPFIRRSFNDLTSFSIFLRDDSNKKVEFESSEKNVSIFNFQIEIFLV